MNIYLVSYNRLIGSLLDTQHLSYFHVNMRSPFFLYITTSFLNQIH